MIGDFAIIAAVVVLLGGLGYLMVASNNRVVEAWDLLKENHSEVYVECKVANLTASQCLRLVEAKGL